MSSSIRRTYSDLGADRFLQGYEISSALHLVVDLGGIEKRANRVCGKIGRCPHPFGGLTPVAKIVTLQLDVISLRIFIVERNRQAGVETEGGFNTFLTQPIIRRHRIMEAVVFEGRVVRAIVTDLFRIIGETG